MANDTRSKRGPAKENPITDLSPEAVSIGRMIDRLAPGTYIIQLYKPDKKGLKIPISIASMITIWDKEVERN